MTKTAYDLTQAAARRIVVALAERALASPSRGGLTPDDLRREFDNEGMATERQFTKWAMAFAEHCAAHNPEWLPCVLSAIRRDWDRAREVRSAAEALHVLLGDEA